MISFSQIMLMGSIFAFMLTAVNLMPPLVRTFQEHYRDRLGDATKELDKVFVHMKISHVVAGSIALGALLAYATSSWAIGGTFAIAGIFVPKIALSVRKSLRSSQFDSQLMDALILINNAMRSGLDIATGIELVASNMTAPISEEFGIVLNAYRLGTPLEVTLQAMTQRINSRILETTITAIIIQRETGGNLIKTFEQLVQTIREESKLQKKIKALSAQGRTQISFLAVFPWVMAIFFYFVSPEMLQPVLATTVGQIAVIVLVFWEAIGVMVTIRIVKVDV